MSTPLDSISEHHNQMQEELERSANLDLRNIPDADRKLARAIRI